ncbi:MAG TPA: hypothetical protein DHV36_22730 [Desulfobacteraceae bacterium]|nr:hypothetical protein [Desulfobacteraceae bacterium]|tara:strand:- start:407 stop:850 length:444 start_codon:yes stop_codon:yes gene_type:complete
MAWDPEKYREKREKVLGVKKRGLSFGTLTVVVAGVILLGMVSLGAPGAISYMKTRHLDDAIFKMADNQVWPTSLVAQIGEIHGVSGTSLDTHNTRLVVTFDRRHTGPDAVNALFSRHGIAATLLNQVSHRQRMVTIEAEKEAEGETP